MSKVSSHRSGTFCWAELGVRDQEAAKAFYTGLFGWETRRISIDEEGGYYTLLQKDGENVAALFSLSETVGAAKGSGGGVATGEPVGGKGSGAQVPPAWMVYFAVEQVEEMAQKAALSGAKIIMDPIDMMEEGRICLLHDPAGAVCGLWQAKNFIGASRLKEPGAICWVELATREPAAAEKFYGGLFGWSAGSKEGSPGTYVEFLQGGESVAGMIKMDQAWGALPAHWMIYVQVEDCEAVARAAETLGGTVKVPPTDVPAMGRFAVIADSQGAVFSVFRPLQAV